MGMLDDVKILDFTHVYFGPYATMLGGHGSRGHKDRAPMGRNDKDERQPIRRHQQHIPLPEQEQERRRSQHEGPPGT